MMRSLGFQILLLGILSGAGINSGAKDFSSWRKYSQAKLISETTALVPGQNGTLGIKITNAPKWHTYWVNPGDSGTPLRLQFKNAPGITVERVLFPIPERELSGPLISFGYAGETLIPIEVKLGPDLKPGQIAHVEVDAEWLVCEDVCIPAFATLTLDMPVAALENVRPSENFAFFQKTRTLIPVTASDFPKFQEHGDKVLLQLPPWSDVEEFADFFPFRSSGVTNVKATFDAGILQFEKSNVPSAKPDRVGILVVKRKLSGKLRAVQYGESGWTFETKAAGAASGGLLWMLLSAFIGGLILNLMPCVFPILSIKLLSLLKLAKGHEREVRMQNIAYVLGVLVSFLSIALLLSLLRSAGHLVGWGFQLQSPVFLALLSWLFFALSLNLLGLYEIDILNASWGHKLTRFGGLWGSFFTGVLAVVVASPCTAPFMGAALGFGLGQSTVVLLSVFFMLGLGLAFPYLLFAIFPSWAKILPRPGAWMKLVKQVMAVPMLLTTIWMIWVLAQVRDIHSVVVVLVGCVALGLAFSLSLRVRRVAQVLTFVVLAGGVFYIYSSENKASAQTRKADDLWDVFSEAAIARAKGRNILVDMTADWCLTCKVNERLVFDDLEVQALLKQKKFLLLKGDWTQRNEEITRFLNRYDRVGVPFYVLYSAQHPGGVTLPEVLTKSSFTELVNKEIP